MESKQRKSIKYGQCFKLGEHVLCCGDATDTDLVNKLLKGHEIKSVISDVPYSVGYVESKAGFKQKLSMAKEITNDHMQSDEEYTEFTKKWLENVKPYLAKKNSVYIFNSDRMIFALRQALLETGFKFSQLLIWIKNAAVVGRLDYLPQHELIAYAWLGTHTFRKSKDKSVIYCPKPSKSKLHPTMKPVSLLRRLVLNSTEVGDTVYDCFAGSGSLLVSAEQTKRKCVLIELDPDYCQTIINRYEKMTGSTAKPLT